MTDTDLLRAGVVGVGSMGSHHARVYNELPSVELVGVADADAARAESTANDYGTEAIATEELLERVDVTSISVPTCYHHDVASAAMEQDVSVLVEKPFVDDAEKGRELIRTARERGLILQAGHIERFNPVVDVLADLLPGLDVIAIAARRLGPPVDRDGDDDIVKDLMIHDIDLVLSLLDRDLEAVSAMSARGKDHVAAQLQFSGDVVGSLTASRVTQEKIRDLSITARNCRVHVDYMDQSVEIHRHSSPEYETDNGDVRFRHESVVERPSVDSGEPLKRELRSFVESVRAGDEPAVTGADGLRALSVADQISDVATSRVHGEAEVNPSEVTTV
jgi:predicted dehydrogenase